MRIQENIINILRYINSENQRKKFLIYFFTLSALFSLLVFGIKGIADGRITYSIIIAVFFILAFANLIILKIYNTIKLSAHFVLLLMFSLELALFSSLGTGTSGLFWYYVFPPLAITLLDNKKGTFYSFILIAVTFIILALKPNFLINTYPKEIIFRFIFTYSIVGLLINIFEYSRNKAHKAYLSNLTEIKEKNDELIAAEEELRQNNEELHSLNENIQSQKDLIQEKEYRLKTIIDNQGEGFAIITLDGTFTFNNLVADDIFDLPKNGLLGKNISDFFNKEQIVSFMVLIDKLKPGKKETIELQIITPKGNKKTIVVTITSDFNKENKISGLEGIFRDITELKKAEIEIKEKNNELTAAEEELRQNNEALQALNENIQSQKDIIENKNKALNKYFTAIEQSAASIVFTDIKGNIEYINPQFSKLTGYTVEEVLGKNPRILKSGKTPNETYTNLWETISNGQTWHGEFINLKKDGTEFYEKAIITPIINPEGEITDFVAIKEDITELKKAENEILEKTAQQRILIDNIPASIFYKNKNLQYVLLNNSYSKMLNIPLKQILGKKYSELFHNNESIEFENFDRNILETKTPIFNIENQHLNNEGKASWVSVSKVPYFDENNNAIGIVGIVQDITERKKAEQLILEQKKQFENTLNNLEDIYFKTDTDGNLLEASPSILKHLGYSSMKEIFENNVFDQFYKNEENKKKLLEELRLNKKIINHPIKFKNKKGELQYGETNANLWFSSSNEILGVEGIIHDITERIKNEEQLKKLNKNLANTIDLTRSQKTIIEKAHKNITDSINYAKSIQNALLPTQELENRLLKEHFILFLPKENVSGDFYYVNKTKENKLLFAAADCTGHGVPGGFMTMLSITFLNGIIRRDKEIKPSNILEQLRGRIKGIFSQYGTKNQNGLDIAFCSIDTKTNILQYAGAYNPLWIIRNNELLEYKATRNPIGFYPKEKQFENHEIQLQNNDLIYVFSDGYQDQTRGEDNRKFTKKRLKDLLLEIHNLALFEQKIILTKRLQDWANGKKQIDDITIMAIKWIIK